MKIRNGFVSNSSSSSFIISNKYDKEEVIKFVKKVLIRTTEKKIEEVNKDAKICPKCGKNLYRKVDIMVMTTPPKYYYECSCGWTNIGY